MKVNKETIKAAAIIGLSASIALFAGALQASQDSIEQYVLKLTGAENTSTKVYQLKHDFDISNDVISDLYQVHVLAQGEACANMPEAEILSLQRVAGLGVFKTVGTVAKEGNKCEAKYTVEVTNED